MHLGPDKLVEDHFMKLGPDSIVAKLGFLFFFFQRLVLEDGFLEPLPLQRVALADIALLLDLLLDFLAFAVLPFFLDSFVLEQNGFLVI